MNLLIFQGATFDETKTWDDTKDISTWTAIMHIKESPFNATILLTMTEVVAAGTGMTLGADGTIRFQISADDTKLLTFGDAVYDVLLIYPSGPKYRAFEGIATVRPAVTLD
jgi:hypothetical protein